LQCRNGHFICHFDFLFMMGALRTNSCRVLLIIDIIDPFSVTLIPTKHQNKIEWHSYTKNRIYHLYITQNLQQGT
jgi:hypothetical protein